MPLNAARPSLLALGIAALMGAAATSASAQTIEWTFHNSYAPTRVESGHVRAFVQDLPTRSNGRIRLNLFEGNAMNLRDADALRWMQTGRPEMGFIWPPFLGRDAADIASLFVFGIVSTPDELNRTMPALREIIPDIMRRWNIEVAGYMHVGLLDASVLCRQPVANLEQLRRVKLRVGTPEQVETFRAIGVAAQIVPQQELYTAMQTGVVDCALYPARIAHTISLQEVAKHGSYVGFPFPPTPYVVMANQARWRALPADLQQVIRTSVEEAMLKPSSNFAAGTAEEQQARERLRGQGVTWHPDFPAADQRAIRDAALKTWGDIAQRTGGQLPAYRQRIMQSLGLSGG